MTEEQKAELRALYIKEREKREKEKRIEKCKAVRDYKDYMRGVYARNAKWSKR